MSSDLLTRTCLLLCIPPKSIITLLATVLTTCLTILYVTSCKVGSTHWVPNALVVLFSSPYAPLIILKFKLFIVSTASYQYLLFRVLKAFWNLIPAVKCWGHLNGLIAWYLHTLWYVFLWIAKGRFYQYCPRLLLLAPRQTLDIAPLSIVISNDSIRNNDKSRIEQNGTADKYCELAKILDANHIVIVTDIYIWQFLPFSVIFPVLSCFFLTWWPLWRWWWWCERLIDENTCY